MKLSTSIFILVFPIGVTAQDTTHRTGIIVHRWPHYKMDGEKLNRKELKQELYKIPNAIPYYRKAQNSLIIGAGLSVATAGWLTFRNNREDDLSNRKLRAADFITAGLSIATLTYVLRHLDNLTKSIRAHNKSKITVY